MAGELEIIPPGATLERHQVPRVVEALATVPWAITDEALATIVAIAQRENEITPEALEAMRARRVANTNDLEVRNGVGILKVSGPMFRYADFFTAFSGGATYSAIAEDMERARADASIQAILIAWDSPGGEVNGCAELASMIRAIAQEKPVESYVGGQACSAAYWLASATSKITVDRTALLGSIGVRLGIRDSRERDAKSGVKTIEFISSNAPNKRTEWDSDAGRARIQRMADQLEAVFISDVAANRGVSEQEVIAKFGAGGVEVGADAVDAGLADALGSFEGVLANLSRGSGRRVTQGRTFRMANPADTPAPAAATFTQAQLDAAASTAQTAGATAAQTRIAAILDSEEAKTRNTQARYLAFQTTMSADDAKKLMAASAQEVPATTPAPAPAPAAQPAPANAPRAQDVAGGLALGTVVDDKGNKTGTQAEAKPLVPSAVYGNRAKAMGQRG